MVMQQTKGKIEDTIFSWLNILNLSTFTYFFIEIVRHWYTFMVFCDRVYSILNRIEIFI